MAGQGSFSLKGAGVSAGIVIGRALEVGRRLPQIQRRSLSDDVIDDEVTRFQHALTLSRSQIEALRAEAACSSLCSLRTWPFAKQAYSRPRPCSRRTIWFYRVC